jgi:hypothetical protein
MDLHVRVSNSYFSRTLVDMSAFCVPEVKVKLGRHVIPNEKSM